MILFFKRREKKITMCSLNYLPDCQKNRLRLTVVMPFRWFSYHAWNVDKSTYTPFSLDNGRRNSASEKSKPGYFPIKRRRRVLYDRE